MQINDLVPITVVFIVAFFIISVGSVIMDDLSVEFCDGTFQTNTTFATGNDVGGNPVYSGSPNYGCCTTFSEGNNCTVWDTDTVSLNASANGVIALEELASWGPTLALVIIAAIMIGILITYLAGGRGL